MRGPEPTKNQQISTNLKQLLKRPESARHPQQPFFGSTLPVENLQNESADNSPADLIPFDAQPDLSQLARNEDLLWATSAVFRDGNMVSRMEVPLLKSLNMFHPVPFCYIHRLVRRQTREKLRMLGGPRLVVRHPCEQRIRKWCKDHEALSNIMAARRDAPHHWPDSLWD